MRVFIIAAMSADGFIARAKDAEASIVWTGAADKKRFVALTKKAKALVMGRKTFETFGRKPLRGRDLFVLTRSFERPGARAPNFPEAPHKDGSGSIEWTSLPPRGLVSLVAGRGYDELAVCGGAMVYAQFLEAGLVDSLYLTVEPVIFGEGVRLLPRPFERRLELVSCEIAEGGSVFLEYRIASEGGTRL
jgi:dihydrofolate reductase